MRALLVERQLHRFAAARLVSSLSPATGVAVGPLRLVERDPPSLPGPDWSRVSPRLAGICGSDLATLDGRSSRWFEDIVSFPFVPGHEVVGEIDAEPGAGPGTGRQRVVVEPVLGCVARAIDPPCPACASDHANGCQRLAFGRLAPGLQTGYCADTGGGWSDGLVAHSSQLHLVPDQMSDDAAVMVEPTACAVHAVLAAGVGQGETVVVLGAGTLGLCVVAALRKLALPASILVVAKHPGQRRLATELGADLVAEPGQTRRAVRRLTGSLAVGGEAGQRGPAGSRAGQRGPAGSRAGQLTGGAGVVMDCVGRPDSLEDALAVVTPRGRVVLVGMPGSVKVDLAPLWQREVTLVGAYAYGRETLPAGVAGGGPARTFELAFELVQSAGLGRLVSARYPLERFDEAIAHAAASGRRGATKIVFDLTPDASRRFHRRSP